MKVPCRWLADYVDIEVTRDRVFRLAERLTLAGLEVEGIEETGPLRGVVVGRVVSTRPHPNSDHLTLCRIEIGDGTVEVVCGAENVVEGGSVPLATVGARLPNGFEIERRRIRGEPSEGMICSKEELGLEDRSEGIWVFDPALDLEIGADLASLLEYDDFVLDFKVTSNRPDCDSIYGVAREIAAIYDLPLRELDTSIDEVKERASDRIAITIEDPKDTLRYAARLMEGIRVGPSPLLIQHRLMKAGMRPLANVVDATNYAMLELGYPLHPFDADLLHGGITIRRAREGEEFRTLDGVTRKLTEEALLIADERGGVALAGVMGGEDSEIREETERVLLEIACFHPYVIRRSARSVGLRSEAAKRFERGLDPEGIPFVADRAAHLIQRLTGCRVLTGLADAYPSPRPPRSVRIRPERASALLGIDLDREGIETILGRLKIETERVDEGLETTIPYFRPDLSREVDLIEEIGRIHGYDRLPSAPPRAVIRIGKKERIERGKDLIREGLTGLGMSEVVTDGFDKPGWRGALGLPADRLVMVKNPMSASQSALRSSLIPGILAVIETNLNQGIDGGMIFELGRVFKPPMAEEERLGGALFGRSDLPLSGKREASLSEAKGILDGLFAKLRLTGISVEAGKTEGFLHPGKSGSFIHRGEQIGWFGELNPSVTERLSHPSTVILFELMVEPLIADSETIPSYSEPSRFPASKRDLSLTAPIALPEAEIRSIIEEEPGVESILLYDLYRGGQLPPDRKSLTYEISLRLPDRTMTDEEVGRIISRIVSRLGEVGVSIRS